MTKARFYTHWKDVKEEDWPWSFFSPREVASKGDGSLLVNFEAMDKLQQARYNVGKPFIINSAYRDLKHNAKIGGAPKSYHLRGEAFDISLSNQDRQELLSACKAAGFTGFGLYDNFIHVDIGPERAWGDVLGKTEPPEEPKKPTLWELICNLFRKS